MYENISKNSKKKSKKFGKFFEKFRIVRALDIYSETLLEMAIFFVMKS